MMNGEVARFIGGDLVIEKPFKVVEFSQLTYEFLIKRHEKKKGVRVLKFPNLSVRKLFKRKGPQAYLYPVADR